MMNRRPLDRETGVSKIVKLIVFLFADKASRTSN